MGAAGLAAASFLASDLVAETSAPVLRRKASIKLMTLRCDGFAAAALVGNSARFLSRNMETSAVLYRSSSHAVWKSAVLVLMMCSARRRSSSGKSSFGISAKYSDSLREGGAKSPDLAPDSTRANYARGLTFQQKRPISAMVERASTPVHRGAVQALGKVQDTGHRVIPLSPAYYRNPAMS